MTRARIILNRDASSGVGAPTYGWGMIGSEWEQLSRHLMEAGRTLMGFGDDAPPGVVPDVRLAERDGQIMVSARIPEDLGSELAVSVTGDRVTISGGPAKDRRPPGREDRSVAPESFHRTLRLPSPVDPERVLADFSGGLLVLSLPLRALPERRPKRRPQRA